MDWNNDGRKDLITGEDYGYIRIYLNTGTDAAPVFNGFTYLQVAGATSVSKTGKAKPEIVDWNNDGKKDVLFGDTGGFVHLLLNTGADEDPVFSSDTFIMNGIGRLLNVGESGRTSPVAVDWNMDGRKDLIVGSGFGRLFYFENKGTDADPVFDGYTEMTADGAVIDSYFFVRPEAVDWDGDGLKDLIVGEYSGTLVYFHALRPDDPWIETFSQSVPDADGDGYLDPGERCPVSFSLWNNGAAATNVTAILSTTSSSCAVISNSWHIGDMPTGSARSNNAAPFVIQISSNAILDRA